MINTAPPASNSVYSREKLFWYDKIIFWNHVCHRGAVVKELLKREDKPGSTPGNAVFCFFIPFFFFFSPICIGLFFSTLFFLLACFSLYILTADPAGHALGSIMIIYFEVRSFILKKVFQKLLICIPARKKKEKKNISCQDMSILWNSWFFFFSVLVDIMTNNTQYTTNCTNLHPTPTSDPLAKVKLAFCTSS